MSNRPGFWLQVKKEYIIENFEELVNYITHYTYSDGANNIDFDATVDCLRELSAELSRILLNTPIYETPDFGEYDDVLVGRVFAVTAYAIHKKNESAHRYMLCLIRLLTATGPDLDEDTQREYLRIAFNCLRGMKIRNLGIGVTDLQIDNFRTILPNSLKRTEFFERNPEARPSAVENHGVCVADSSNTIDVAPMNFADYAKYSLKLKTLFDLAGMIQLKVRPEDYSRISDFEEADRDLTGILKMMNNVHPSPKVSLKSYVCGTPESQDILLRVTAVDGYRIEAETIDPAYKKITGNVFLDRLQHGRPPHEVFRRHIKPGTYLRADYANNPAGTFLFSEDFETFYRNVASEKAGHTFLAVFVHRYSNNQGSVWITEDGVRVSIEDNKLDTMPEEIIELYENASVDGMPMKVQFYWNPPDFEAQNFRTYGSPVEDYYACKRSEQFTIDEAECRIVADYLADCARQAEEVPTVKAGDFSSADPLPLKIATAIFHSILSSCTSSVEKLEYIYLSMILSKITDSEKDYAYLDHERQLLGRLVAFAHNKEVAPLPCSPLLEGVERVERDAEMVARLSEYRRSKENISAANLGIVADTENAYSKALKLIDASNSLIDIIEDVEVNNIKQNIARLLNVDDEYTSILADRTYYGQESISLEFKKSIVFPPANKRRFSAEYINPEMQKWAILKAICGFLNSRAGGELLLGVSDDGYAWGIEEDTKALYQQHLITYADADHFRQYVQRVVGPAFRCGEGGEPTDISRICLTYNLEENSENKTVLRIKVTPYPYGVVEIGLDDIPDGYVRGYVRQSGQTVMLSDELRRSAEAYKRSAAKASGQDMVQLAKAMEEKLVVLLKDYRSASGTATRRMHVYKLWPERNLIYGYDLDRKAPRLFKSTRCSAIELTDEQWSQPQADRDGQIDVFGMLLERAGRKVYELRLTDYARMLLIEEHPDAASQVNTNYDSNRTKYPWVLRCSVSNPSGLNRFVAGLPDDTILTEAS